MPHRSSPNDKLLKRMTSSISLRVLGAPNSLDYKVYFEKEKKLISPFHDIDLHEGQFLNMVRITIYSSINIIIYSSIHSSIQECIAYHCAPPKIPPHLFKNH